MNKLLILDADSLIWVVSYNNRDNLDLEVHKQAIDNFIEDIITRNNCNQYLLFLTSGSFRYDVATIKPYKGNRKSEKPLYFYELKQHLKDKWNAISHDKLEADDLCLIYHTCYPNSIIASPDKDLRQVAGNFYDYRNSKEFYVSQYEADYRFALSLIVGDATDNIGSVKNYGEVKAKALLEGLSYYYEMEQVVLNTYKLVYGTREGILQFAENFNLLYIIKDIIEAKQIDRDFKLVEPIDFKRKELPKLNENLWD